MIEKLTMASNEIVDKLKAEYKNMKLENKSIIRERDSLKSKYNNLRKITNKLNLKNNAPISKWTKRDVFDRDNHTCLACGTTNNLTIDHIKPRIIGGTNDFDNLQTICQHCNLAKGVNVVDYRNNKIESLIKREKKTHSFLNFTENGMLDINI